MVLIELKSKKAVLDLPRNDNLKKNLLLWIYYTRCIPLIFDIVGSDFDCTWTFDEAPTAMYKTQADISADSGINRIFGNEQVL